MAEGKAQASIIKAENDKSCNVLLAQKTKDVAQMNAESVSTDASAESEIADVLLMRRSYSYMHSKLGVVEAAAENKNLKIFGEGGNEKILT